VADGLFPLGLASFFGREIVALLRDNRARASLAAELHGQSRRRTERWHREQSRTLYLLARATRLNGIADCLLPLPTIELLSRYHYRLSAECKRVDVGFKTVCAARIPA